MRSSNAGWSFGALAIVVAAACSPAPAPAPQGTPGTPGGQQTAGVPGAAQMAVRCEPSERMAVEGRTSPYDSTTIALGGAEAKVCYGRPSARGRTMLGGEAVPYGQVWRTGANEPTIVHLPFAAEIAGMRVEAGSYSLYTIPGEAEWTVIVNRSTAQWGHESQYTEQVRAQDVGRATLPAERAEQYVETFTIRSDPRGQDQADLILEWENTRVRIPVRSV